MSFEFPKCSHRQKLKLLRHAQAMLSAQEFILNHTGQSVLQYVLQNVQTPIHMDHYPKGDRIDHDTGAQYFYHCHREDLQQEEHGHFHCFIRYPQIPAYIKPARIMEWDKYMDNPMTHLIAVSLNRYGVPIRLFTVNRWISSEVWYHAKHAATLLNRFKMTLTDPYWQPMDQWMESLLKLFAPQITWLLQQRDQFTQQQQRDFPELNVYEDERFEELSSLSINIQQQIEWLIQPVSHHELSY